MTLKVIGAGFGRTGTDSLREALDILGFGPCHHMFTVSADAGQRTQWRELALGAEPDWPRLFAGYASCVDWPSAFYWRDLIRVYPDAQVILTLRSAESWWDSFSKTLLTVMGANSNQDALPVTLIARQVFGGRPDDRETAIAAYKANTQAVLATVPSGRLLVHEVGAGWDRLCAHLGVPVPDQPYPSRNSAEELIARTAKP